MKFSKDVTKKLYDSKGKPKRDEERREVIIPLALIPETYSKDEMDSRTKGSYLLAVDPSRPLGAEYKFSMYHVDGTESLRLTIQWYKDIQKVIKGLGLYDQPEGMVPLIEATCHASAQSAFQDVLNATIDRLNSTREVEFGNLVQMDGEADEDFLIRQQEEEQAANVEFALTREHVFEAMRAVIKNACPYKALQKQRFYMRRHMRKPYSMPIRTFVHNVMKMNHEELPYLPPFGRTQQLSQDDIIEIIINAIPNSWNKEMTRQNFDALSSSVRDVLDFCERIEQVEPQTKANNSSKQPENGNHKRTQEW